MVISRGQTILEYRGDSPPSSSSSTTTSFLVTLDFVYHVARLREIVRRGLLSAQLRSTQLSPLSRPVLTVVVTESQTLWHFDSNMLIYIFDE